MESAHETLAKVRKGTLSTWKNDDKDEKSRKAVVGRNDKNSFGRIACEL